jgi:hypothetical protein
MILSFIVDIASFLIFLLALIGIYQDMAVKHDYEWLLKNYMLDHKVMINNPQLEALKVFEVNGTTKFKFRRLLRKLLDR